MYAERTLLTPEPCLDHFCGGAIYMYSFFLVEFSGAGTISSLGGQESRRRDRDAEGVEREGNGEGGFPLPSRPGAWGSVVSSPSGVPRPKSVLMHCQFEKHIWWQQIRYFFVYYWYVKVPLVWCLGHSPCLPSGYATGWADTTNAEHFIITI